MQTIKENTQEKVLNDQNAYSFYIQTDNHKKETNMIITSKYTLINFLPKMLFEQFSKKIYLYFIIICFIEVISD